jgi:hypothetical protein
LNGYAKIKIKNLFSLNLKLKKYNRLPVLGRGDGGRQTCSFCIFAEIDRENLRKCYFFDFLKYFLKNQ